MDDKPKPSVHFCQVGLLPTQRNPQSHQCGQYGGGHMICFFCPEEPAEVVHKHSPSRPVERGSTGFSGRRGSRGPASTAPDGGSEVEPPGVQTQQGQCQTLPPSGPGAPVRLRGRNPVHLVEGHPPLWSSSRSHPQCPSEPSAPLRFR